MKKRWSILGLWCAMVFPRLAAVLAATAAVQILLFCWPLFRGTGLWLDALMGRPAWAAAAGFLLLCWSLCRAGCETGGSRWGYTLRRLRVREETLVLWWGGGAALCFFLYWMSQLAVVLFLCQVYFRQALLEPVTEQSLFLAAYRISYFHNLLPLDNWTVYLRNGALCLALGVSAAYCGYCVRRGTAGRGVMWMLLMAPATLVAFIVSQGLPTPGASMEVVGLAVLAVVVQLYWLRNWREEVDGDETGGDERGEKEKTA